MNRNYGEFVLDLPSVGPFRAFCMVRGEFPEWVEEFLGEGLVGFFERETPGTVGKYWMRGGGVYLQGDWIVLMEESVRRFPREVFESLFVRAGEVRVPDFRPTGEMVELAGEIAGYQAKFSEATGKAYYYWLEVFWDMLLHGFEGARVEKCRAYLAGLVGQSRKAKFFGLLERGVEMYDEWRKGV